MRRLIHQRNAASVLPLPVGARTSVESPRAIAGQPSTCARVGEANDAANQSRTAGWKRARTSGAIDPSYPRGEEPEGAGMSIAPPPTGGVCDGSEEEGRG